MTLKEQLLSVRKIKKDSKFPIQQWSVVSIDLDYSTTLATNPHLNFYQENKGAHASKDSRRIHYFVKSINLFILLQSFKNMIK